MNAYRREWGKRTGYNKRKQPYTEAKKARNKRWEAANPEVAYWSQRKAIWRQRGIQDVDTIDWEAFVEAQGNACFVCGKPIDAKSAHRDHDHQTGLTRAAVCGNRCNWAMEQGTNSPSG